MAKRKAGTERGVTWMRVADASRALDLPRSTLTGRIARGEYRTKTLIGVLLVAVPSKRRSPQRTLRSAA